MIHPLIHNDQRAFHLMKVRNGVLSQYGNTIGIDQFRDTVVDLRVNMVWTSC